ncbi:MAG: hypothetical protein WC418_04690 [Candidatus Omnitrophota bacterium]|jgi:hypothetical protein
MKKRTLWLLSALVLVSLGFSMSYAGDPGENGDPTKEVMDQSSDGLKKAWKKASAAIDPNTAASQEAADKVGKTQESSKQKDQQDKQDNSAGQHNNGGGTRGNGMAMSGGQSMGMGGGMSMGGMGMGGGRGMRGGMFFPGGGMGGYGGGSNRQPGTGGGDSTTTQEPTGGDTTGGDDTTTAEPTESAELNTLIEKYTSATDQETARAALSDIVELVKSDSSLEEAFIDYFNLTGTALEIWDTYNVLVTNSESGTDFTQTQLSEIAEVLASLPSEDVALISVVTTTTASEGSSDSLLGFTYTDTDNGTVVINTSSSYISTASDGLQTFAGTLSHEIGHRVQYSLSATDSAAFTALHEASGTDVENYASSYGMTEYSSSDPGYEDFATMYEAWCTDSETLIARAESQAASGSTILLEKVEFMAKLFAHTGSDGNTYTYIYTTDSSGNVSRTEVLLGSDGLPVTS